MKAKFLSALLLLAATVFSCTPSELIQPDGSSGEKHDVRVTLSVLEQSPATKSSFSATQSNIDNVNIWVVTGGQIVSHQYLGQDQSAVIFSLQKQMTYSFYALANIYRDMSGDFTTLDQLKACAVQMPDIDMSLASRSFPMAGVSESLTLDRGSANVDVPLERLFSKVVFKFSPDTDLAAQNVKVQSVVLRNAAGSVLPFSAGGYAPAVYDGDYASVSDISTLNEGGQIEFYCMENCCGKTNNNDPWSKLPEKAPYGSPTYVEMKATVDGFQMSGNITYRFCIGADNTSDYNLRRNMIYTVTLKGVYTTIDGSDDSWKIDSGDMSTSEGEVIRLYIGEFHKIALREGDKSAFYNKARGTWTEFAFWEDNDNYTQTLPNGACITSCATTDVNSELYVYSTARLSDESEQLKVTHSDGTVDLYTVRPPVAPTAFVDFESGTGYSVSDDGYGILSLDLEVTGPLGHKPVTAFAIPAGEYREAGNIPFSDKDYKNSSYVQMKTFDLPAHLRSEWEANMEDPVVINSGIADSKKWTLFHHLYLSNTSDVDFGTATLAATGNAAGAFFDCLNYSVSPKIRFYGMDVMNPMTFSLTSRVFSQNINLAVATCFPSQGHLGERWNYELAPNSLYSTSGGTLPKGISDRASFTIEGNNTSYIRLSGLDHKITFTSPANGAFTAPPAAGHYTFRGTVTNPFTKVVKEGTYSADIILYLPLISYVSVNTDYSTTSKAELAVTAAVAADATFGNTPWEDFYGKIFNSTLGYETLFRLDALTASIYPDGSTEYSTCAHFSTNHGIQSDHNYTLQYLAEYAGVELEGFKRDDNIVSSVDIYPSANTINLDKIGEPVYVKLVLFSDVTDGTVTPVYDYYKKGNYLYQLLWGVK